MRLSLISGLALILIGIFVPPLVVLSYQALNLPKEPFAPATLLLLNSPSTRIDEVLEVDAKAAPVPAPAPVPGPVPDSPASMKHPLPVSASSNFARGFTCMPLMLRILGCWDYRR